LDIEKSEVRKKRNARGEIGVLLPVSLNGATRIRQCNLDRVARLPRLVLERVHLVRKGMDVELADVMDATHGQRDRILSG
jgi:hypothetical protein